MRKNLLPTSDFRLPDKKNHFRLPDKEFFTSRHLWRHHVCICMLAGIYQKPVNMNHTIQFPDRHYEPHPNYELYPRRSDDNNRYVDPISWEPSFPLDPCTNGKSIISCISFQFLNFQSPKNFLATLFSRACKISEDCHSWNGKKFFLPFLPDLRPPPEFLVPATKT